MKSLNKSKIAFITLGLISLVGGYNAVVINSDSHLSNSDMRFSKRLDEVLGVTTPGRKVASDVKWLKLESEKIINKEVEITKVVQNDHTLSAPKFEEATAVVKDELSLNLVEVINPTKWKNGLSQNQFFGNITTNDGVIENLHISLPNGEGFSVSFLELTGNVFEYDLNGERFSGMMYQVDQHAYMISLTNGPLEGSRLRFAAENAALEQQDAQDYLADHHNIKMGTLGSDSAPDLLDETSISEEQLAVSDDLQSVGFNL